MEWWTSSPAIWIYSAEPQMTLEHAPEGFFLQRKTCNFWPRKNGENTEKWTNKHMKAENYTRCWVKNMQQLKAQEEALNIGFQCNANDFSVLNGLPKTTSEQIRWLTALLPCKHIDCPDQAVTKDQEQAMPWPPCRSSRSAACTVYGRLSGSPTNSLPLPLIHFIHYKNWANDLKIGVFRLPQRVQKKKVEICLG